MSVDSFIRFKDENGKTVYGEPTTSLSHPLKGTEASLLHGDPLSGFSKSEQKVKVVELLCPLESTPIVLCVGLNYRHHANEAKVRLIKILEPIMWLTVSSFLFQIILRRSPNQ